MLLLLPLFEVAFSFLISAEITFNVNCETELLVSVTAD